jgi:hypothetical protein
MTHIRGSSVWHYTCNAPSDEILERKGITAIGHEHETAPREVLLIPLELYAEHGVVVSKNNQNVLIIQSEGLLTKLQGS